MDEKKIEKILKAVLKWSICIEKQYELSDEITQLRANINLLETEKRKAIREIILILNDSRTKTKTSNKKNEGMYR